MQLRYFPLLCTLWIGVTCSLALLNTDRHACLFVCSFLAYCCCSGQCGSAERPNQTDLRPGSSEIAAAVIRKPRLWDALPFDLHRWIAVDVTDGLWLNLVYFYFCFPLFLYWKPLCSFIMLSSWEVLCVYLLNLEQHELIAKSVILDFPSYSCFQTLALWTCCLGA